MKLFLVLKERCRITLAAENQQACFTLVQAQVQDGIILFPRQT
jgi:hypothetical protein